MKNLILHTGLVKVENVVSKIKRTIEDNCYERYCVKSVQIRSFFWSVFFRIRTEYGKIRTRKNSVFGNFSQSTPLLRVKKYIAKPSPKLYIRIIIYKRYIFWDSFIKIDYYITGRSPSTLSILSRHCKVTRTVKDIFFLIWWLSWLCFDKK